MITYDPVFLAIKAFYDIPNTRFRQPIGPYENTYELVAYMEEIVRFSSEVHGAIEVKKEPPPTSDAFIYFYPP